MTYKPLSIDTIVEENKAKESPEDKCKGWYFRGKVNTFFNGDFRKDIRLTLLKRKSCKGCGGCDWLFEYITDDYDMEPYDLSHIEHGKLYELVASGGGGYWTECGMEYDGPDISFELVDE